MIAKKKFFALLVYFLMLSLMYVPAEAVTSKQKGFLAPYFDAVCIHI